MESHFTASKGLHPYVQIFSSMVIADSGGDEAWVGARGVYSETLAVRRCLQPLGTSSSRSASVGGTNPARLRSAPRFGPHGE